VRLAERGSEVTGIDFSRRSIEYAKNIAAEKSLNINYLNQNYLDFKVNEQFDLIIMIMCDFCALSPGQRKTLLKVFHNALKPGGSVLLDVYSLTAFEQREEISTFEENLLNGFWSAEQYFGFMNTFKYDDVKVVLDKYTIVESNRIRTIYNWLQYFDPEDLKKEFLQCGFKIESFYSDVAGMPFDAQSSEFAVVARRQ
jgi:SAM-dependent methyltransferase